MISVRSLPSFRTPAANHASPPVSAGIHRGFVMTDASLVIAVSIFIFLTSALFALSLKPVAALIVGLGSVGGVWLIASRTAEGHADILQAPLLWRRLALCVGLATVLMLLGGETHLFYANPDWRTRDAVLSDLVLHGMGTVYDVDGTNYILRAPLGMYIIPSLVGRLGGIVSAHVAMLAQNALFLGSTFYLMLALGRGWIHLAILVLFAGLVIVPDLMRLAITHGSFHLTTVFDAWVPFWQYSSSMLQFFWVPNHALPGWWLAALLLLSRRSGVDDVTLGVTAAGLALWSPLAIVPVVPWLMYRAAVAWRSILRSPRTWHGVAIAACFTPILVYLVQGSATIAHSNAAAVPDLGFWYPFFIGIQLPAFAFGLVYWRHVPKELRALLMVNGLFLALLPIVSFGPSNDLARRGSIASLTILGFIFGGVVLDLYGKRAVGALVGSALIVATLPSAANEILRAIMLPRAPISTCTLMEASVEFGDKQLPTNYVVARDTVPGWLFDTSASPISTTPARICSRRASMPAPKAP